MGSEVQGVSSSRLRVTGMQTEHAGRTPTLCSHLSMVTQPLIPVAVELWSSSDPLLPCSNWALQESLGN